MTDPVMRCRAFPAHLPARRRHFRTGRKRRIDNSEAVTDQSSPADGDTHFSRRHGDETVLNCILQLLGGFRSPRNFRAHSTALPRPVPKAGKQ